MLRSMFDEFGTGGKVKASGHMTTTIVFGGAGFIGSHLLEHLSHSISDRLVSIDLREPHRVVPGVDYQKADVRNLQALDIKGPISTVFNLAAVHTTPGHPTCEYYETNVLGAVEVTSWADKHDVPEIIFTSSIAVYGAGDDPKTEDSVLAPASAYGWSKMLAERIHRGWRESGRGRHLVIVRPGAVFGPGEGGNFARLASLLRKGAFIYPGRRDTVKACFYVGDLVDAVEKVRHETDDLITFNGCYPDRYTIEQIVEAFRRDHFPGARTISIPRAVVVPAASMLRPISKIGLGIHPDRVMKLVQSTDIIPQWLQARGLAEADRLPTALARWSDATEGRFN